MRAGCASGLRPKTEMKWVAKGLLVAAVGAGVFALYTLLQTFLHGGPFSGLLLWIATSGCFGFLVGGILAFDPESKVKVKANSFARTLIGAGSGAALALLWNWPGDALMLAALLGATLGYMGMIWAKYLQHL
jgi:hypothetical protein